MAGYKTARWTNALGVSVYFDNAGKYYIESIDMTGNSADFTSSPIACADGQTTTDVKLAPKVIPCSFALFDTNNSDTVLTWLSGVFFPKVSGKLTVYTDNDTYRISCRPQTVPTFTREAVGCVWRFNVDFVADYPYWRKGSEHSVTLDSNAVTVTSECPFDIPPKIIFPANNADITFSIQHRLTSSDSWSTSVDAFKVCGTLGNTARNFPLMIDTQTLRITNANTGANVNNWVDASAQTDKALIKYGQTQIVCMGTFASDNRPTLSYYVLSMGEL